MQNKDSIETFCNYFQDRIDEIEALNNPLYQKILIVILLDTSSRVWTKGLENKNKLRFLKMVGECIRWQDSDKISIPMTFYRLENVDFKVNDALKSIFSDLLHKFQEGRILRLDIDPLYFEIEHLAENCQEKKILNNSRHAELFYTYRNNLIHEFRKPGHGMEFSDDNESPYYHSMTDLVNNHDIWELVYPTAFFISIAKIALDSIKAFLTFNDLDPYSFFKFGSPW